MTQIYKSGSWVGSWVTHTKHITQFV